jgi:hypothetical protein
MIDWYWILEGRASTRLIWMARALACDMYTWDGSITKFI